MPRASTMVMRRAVLLALPPFALLLIVLAAWFVDAGSDDDRALRNVAIGGRVVGGLDREELIVAVEKIAAEYAKAKVVVHTPKGDMKTTAKDVGLAIDVKATVQLALDEGRKDALPLRPIRWLTSLFSTRDADVVAHTDRAAVQHVVTRDDPTGRVQPVEPGVIGEDGQISVVLGEDGKGLDHEAVAAAIDAAAANGQLPVEVDAKAQRLRPRFTKEDAEALVDRAKAITKEPVTVRTTEDSAVVPGSMVRSWITSEPGADGLDLALDDDEVLADLAKLLDDVGREPEDATITVEGGRPVIVRGVVGQSCCAPETVPAILEALLDERTSVAATLTEVDPETTSADLEKLGITEQIATFTTPHKCCQNRVTNIHRIADLVRGTIIKPGQRFSVNDFVGKRTTENGFIVDHAIEGGVFVETVGGGISQFATTTFNAAFFGGLDIVEYQSHSIYISRYPYGREATLSYPKPDLVIGNNTPHGVLIWPTYTNTSLTVTLYSTKFVHGEQTGQSERPVGVAGCKRVTTTRTRTYVDGRTETDQVFATYRPAEGIQCGGPANQTPATSSTTTTAPPPTTTTTQPPDESPPTTAGG